MWKKSVCRQPNTKYVWKSRHAGQIDLFMGLLSVFLVVLVMIIGLKLSHFMIAGAYMEDALAASNLASALIDIEEYGKSHILRIKDPQEAYDIYKEALSVNLELDEEGQSAQKALLEGPVKILAYMVYNVEGDRVDVFSLSEGETMQKSQSGETGQIYTPDGILVETTTIYSRISFLVKGLGKQYIYAEKEKSVDVKRNQEK